MGKFDKHVAFVSDLLRRPPGECTEAERAALYRTPLARDYAANVLMLGNMTGEKFFEAYPKYVAQAEQGIALVEAEQAADDGEQTKRDELRAEIDGLKAQIAKLMTLPADEPPPAPVETPADEPPAE